MSIHKGTRVAMELGVYPLDSYKPEVIIPDEDLEFGRKYTEGMKRPIGFIHAVAGNHPKTLPMEKIQEFVAKTVAQGGTAIECDSIVGDKSVKYKPTSIMKTAGILKCVDFVICIDSVVLHLCHALGVSTNAIFTMTPPEQVFTEVPSNIQIIKGI